VLISHCNVSVGSSTHTTIDMAMISDGDGRIDTGNGAVCCYCQH
jgi:hypothetical protein